MSECRDANAKKMFHLGDSFLRRVLVHQVDQWQYQPAARHEWDVVCAYSGVKGVIHVIMRGQ